MASSSPSHRRAAIVFLCLPAAALAEPPKLKWGLESTHYYSEAPVNPSQNLLLAKRNKKRNLSPPPPIPSRAFAFKSQDAFKDGLDRCLNNHFAALRDYEGSLHGAPPVQADFVSRRTARDPYCVMFSRLTAPMLYFDLTAKDERQYVLEEIVVDTFSFNEYAGGGFVEKEASYDIVVAHQVGRKAYPIGEVPSLAFKNTGRVTLRLWSDNYYPAQGWIAPMGNFLISITFRFRAAGRIEEVSTGPFSIDI